MAQIFHHSANALSRLSIAGALVLVAGAGAAVYAVDRSGFNQRRGVVQEQPVPFSHEHHVKGLGIDCRYCHTAVEVSSSAGIPPTATCMNCHKIIWNDAPMLEPVRSSLRTGTPLKWTRVHDLPDFVFFNHSIHVAKGVGCASCHGRVDEMPLMRQTMPLQMDWCLGCHRNPAPNLRPRDEITSMTWESSDPALAERLAKEYKIRGPRDLAGCEMCHR